MAASGKKHSPAKIILKCVAGLIIALAAILVGFDAYIFSLSPDFYDTAKREMPIPGTSSGFIVQDIEYMDEAGTWLFSGYGTDNTSPIYRGGEDGDQAKINVELEDGSLYDGHGSGITSDDGYIYLTCDNGYCVIEADELASTPDGGTVKAKDTIDVGFDPAFLNIVDGMLTCGVFYYAGPYDTPDYMHITTPDGTLNHAIMYAYGKDDSQYGFAQTPSYVYSIPDKVQGVCISDSGNYVFSTSWGLAASQLIQYEADRLTADGTFNVDGEDIPLYCFDTRSYVDTVSAPPMSEGIVSKDGRIWIPNEAASNKYVFGKLYGAGWVYSLDM